MQTIIYNTTTRETVSPGQTSPFYYLPYNTTHISYGGRLVTPENIPHAIPGYAAERVPDYWCINPLTGAEFSPGDSIRNGADTVGSIDYNANLLHITGHTSAWLHPDWVWWVRRNTIDLPELPKGKLDDEGYPVVETSGGWVRVRALRNYNGVWYGDATAVVLYGRVVPHSRAMNGTLGFYDTDDCVPVRDRINTGARFHTQFIDPARTASETVVLRGRRYTRRSLYVIYNAAGEAVRQRVTLPAPYSDWARLHSHYRDGYAAALCRMTDAIVTRCYGNFPRNECDSRWDGEDIPQWWLDENTDTCQSCGERFLSDDMTDGYCDDCYRDHDDDDDSECSLPSYTSPVTMTPEDDSPFKIGIEIEMEPSGSRRSAIRELQSVFDLHGYCALKDDGSLSYNGIEMVTRPDDPGVHARILGSGFGRITALRADSNCGIHIHLNRAKLTPLWIGRMLVFLNSPANESVIRTACGRYSCNYSRRKSKKLTDGKCVGDRYEFLNLNNRHTVEFRLFAGSVDPVRIVSNIHFVSAVREFCGPAGRALSDLTKPDRFREFVRSRRRDWPELYGLLFAAKVAEVKAKLDSLKKPVDKTTV